MYSRQYLIKVKNGLIELKSKVVNNELISKSMGVCGNLTVIIRDDSFCYDLINQLMDVWANEEVSLTLKIDYPRCRKNGTMWTGEYLEYRLLLIDYLINKIESILENLEGEHYVVSNSK